MHFTREIDKLKKKILSLGTIVEERVRDAVRAVAERDEELALSVIEADDITDQFEVEIEEDCLKILALHQPVAVDLRFIVAVLKINNDLERIGDLAVNIAQKGVYMAREATVGDGLEFDFKDMSRKTQAMLKKSLDALVNMDSRLAREVRQSDDEVDAINRATYVRIKAAIKHDTSGLNRLLNQLLVSRSLERIADYATNIAEDVIYMINGEIVRHRSADSGNI